MTHGDVRRRVCRSLECVYAVLGAYAGVRLLAEEAYRHNYICRGGVDYLADVLAVEHYGGLALYPVVVRKARAEHSGLFGEGEQNLDGSVFLAALFEPCYGLDYLRYAGLVIRAENRRTVRIYEPVALNGSDRRAGSYRIGVAGEKYALALAGQIAVYIEAVRAAFFAGLLVALDLEAHLGKRLFKLQAECALVPRFAARRNEVAECFNKSPCAHIFLRIFAFCLDKKYIYDNIFSVAGITAALSKGSLESVFCSIK